MMDTTRSETTLDDLESFAFPKDQIGDRHSHVRESDFAMAVWGVVITIHRQHAFDLHALYATISSRILAQREVHIQVFRQAQAPRYDAHTHWLR
jgi:hypothetical protein